MATYRNKKTGATITTDLIISGGDWEIEEKKKKEPKKNANKDVPLTTLQFLFIQVQNPTIKKKELI